jgi:adenylate kinase
MRVVLLGPPGAGKGTQAHALTDRLGIPKISTGEMLRSAAQKGTPAGKDARVYTDRGLLVPDAMILKLMEERLSEPDATVGFLLDGFPRTTQQAEALGNWLAERGLSLDLVIGFNVPDAEIIRRISARRVCGRCQESYHLVNRPPRVAGECDECGTALVQREDDRPEPVQARLDSYHKLTQPVVDYYRERGSLLVIDGTKPVEAVTEEIVAAFRR